MDRTFGLFNSQRLLLKLIDKGLNREDAYDKIQPRAMQAWKEERSFREIIDEAGEITELLSVEEIDDAFDVSYHLRNVDLIFERVGLG